MSKHIEFKDLILAEDDNLIFINKPSGVSSLDERATAAPSILAMGRKYCETIQLCHRLDKETSGVLVCAKNPDAYREMAIAFESRMVSKVYHAFVSGYVNVQQKSIVLPLSVTRNGLAKVDMKEGKPAETIVTALHHYKRFTLVECRPVTGRLHQIRVHLASQNIPIVADETYGGRIPFLSELKKGFKESKWENAQGMIRRVALHAYSISFTAFGKSYDVAAPYPKDMEVFKKLLDKHDS